ncbi:MAG: Actin- protein 6, partial [Piccolia ochrophora]
MPRQPKPPPRIVPDTTLVVDNGAHTIKAGFATDAADPDVDCRQIPNCLARSRDKRVWIGAQLEHCKDFGEMSFRRPVEKGYLVNWEAEKEIWDESFFSQKAVLKCDPHETNLILTEAPNALPALQSNTDQMIFEEFEFASYYRCTGPTLNSYNDIQAIYHASYPPDSPSHQTEAILVVDSGYSHTTINPLLNNRPIHAAVRRLDIGGKFLTNYLKELVSMRHYDMMDETHLMNQVKEAVCYVSSDFTADLD